MSSHISLRHRLEYALFWVLEGLLRLLSWRAAQALGRAVGSTVYLASGHYRRLVRDNLRRSDLGLSEDQISAVARDCFKHYGSLFLTAVHLLHMKPEEVKRWVHLDGFERWDAAKATGKGFIVMTAHYGNWEAMAMAMAATGRTLAAIGRKLGNPLLETKLLALRSRLGNRVIYKEGGVRESIRELRAGRGTGILMDQDALTRGVFVRFMGQWASTYSSAALLAVKYRVPVLPIFSTPHPDGTFSASVLPPLEIPLTGDLERDAWTATQIMTWSLESQIREDPRWWFWMHNRFKTRPTENYPLPPEPWQAAIQHLAPKPRM